MERDGLTGAGLTRGLPGPLRRAGQGRPLRGVGRRPRCHSKERLVALNGMYHKAVWVTESDAVVGLHVELSGTGPVRWMPSHLHPV